MEHLYHESSFVWICAIISCCPHGTLTPKRPGPTYCGWTKSISHHLETMVETITFMKVFMLGTQIRNEGL